MKIITVIFCIGYILFCSVRAEAQSQLLYGEVEDRSVLPNGDTLLSKRGYGEWWFGINGGFNFNANMGNLRLPRTYNELRNSILDYGGGLGVGYYLGLVGEWNSPDNRIGGLVNLTVLDVHKGNFETARYTIDSKQTYFESETAINYITLSPSVRYKFPNFLIPTLYGYGGLDVELGLTNSVRNRQVDVTNTALVNEFRPVKYSIKGVRLGLHAGVGFEFLLMEVLKTYRVRMSPFMSFHYGTTVADDYGSNWQLGFARAGFSLKLSKNEVIEGVLPFDPSYKAPAVILAALSIPKRIELATNISLGRERLEVSSLEFREPEKIEGAIQIAEDINSDAEKAETKPKEDTKPKIEVPKPKADVVATTETPKPNVLRRNNAYSSPTNTDVDKTFITYLDGVVEYLKTHPKATVQVVGHTETFGSATEMQQVSLQRAVKVRDYMTKKGIPQGRILITGQANRSPRGNNNTADGRRLNRRVEVTIVE